ncbi:MAG: nucleotidyltransferase family protein [Clostridia bacterium]|nr:nucleotidyltransferase family protein [Clostridia bacterium]
MTPQFETMLRFFGGGATGNVNTNPGDIDVDAVVSFANSQGVWTVVYPALSKVCDASKYHIAFLKTVSDSIRRNEFTLNILGKIADAGIEVCILKGVVAASAYANPDCRISSDTDILINPKDEKKIAKLLTENGYTVDKRRKNDHHMKATHPIGGLLEAHVSLYSKTTEKILFGSKKMYEEPWRELEIGGNHFKTLGINDHLNYLTAHYIKHFVTGGASIRQMMDLLLYLKKHEKEIDFDRYNNLLTELRYEKLIDAVRSIGALYFGLDFEITEKELANKLLEDCESVGLFGVNSKGSASVYNDYCRKRKDISSWKLRFIFWFQDELSVFNRLFPGKKLLIKKGYAYAKHSWLVPVAWIHHIFDAILRRSGSSSEKQDNDEQKNERKQLMKTLGMIE